MSHARSKTLYASQRRGAVDKMFTGVVDAHAMSYVEVKRALGLETPEDDDAAESFDPDA
jgi:hypothetical protein